MEGAAPKIAVLAILVLFYGFLALFRSARSELSRLRLDNVLEEAGRDGGLLGRWTERSNRHLMMVAAQIASQVALVLVVLLTANLIGDLRPAWLAPQRLGTSFLLTVVVLIVLVRSVLCRLIASLYPTASVRVSIPLVAIAGLALLPVLLPTERLVAMLTRRLARDGSEAKSEDLSEQEVHAFVSLGEEEGILEEDEGDLVRNVVDFGNTIVREVMTPRIDMVVVDSSARLGEVRDIFLLTKHSRVPVQRGTVDRVEGLLNLKDLLPIWSQGKETSIEHLVRPVMFIPETKRVKDLLREMQKARAQFAIVVDEYGGTAGVVTVEDLVEEIVGEIQDEHEAEEDEIVSEAHGVWLVSGLADVDDVGRAVGLDVGSGDFDTLGGFITSLLGRVPDQGEALEQAGVRMEVVAADSRRIFKVRISRVGEKVPVEGKHR